MEQTGERTAVRPSDSHTGSPVCRQEMVRTSHSDHKLGLSASFHPATEIAEQEQKMSDHHNNTTDTVSHAEDVLRGKHTEHRGTADKDGGAFS